MRPSGLIRTVYGNAPLGLPSSRASSLPPAPATSSGRSSLSSRLEATDRGRHYRCRVRPRRRRARRSPAPPAAGSASPRRRGAPGRPEVEHEPTALPLRHRLRPAVRVVERLREERRHGSRVADAPVEAVPGYARLRPQARRRRLAASSRPRRRAAFMAADSCDQLPQGRQARPCRWPRPDGDRTRGSHWARVARSDPDRIAVEDMEAHADAAQRRRQSGLPVQATTKRQSFERARVARSSDRLRHSNSMPASIRKTSTSFALSVNRCSSMSECSVAVPFSTAPTRCGLKCGQPCS